MKEQALYHWPGVAAYLSKQTELRARSSPWHLQTFVVGCQLAFSELALDIRGDVQLLDGFCKFVVTKYGKHPNIWYTFMSLVSAPNDGASRFLEDWTEYITPLRLHATPVPWVIPDRRSRAVDIRPHLKEFRKKPNFIFSISRYHAPPRLRRSL